MPSDIVYKAAKHLLCTTAADVLRKCLKAATPLVFLHTPYPLRMSLRAWQALRNGFDNFHVCFPPHSSACICLSFLPFLV